MNYTVEDIEELPGLVEEVGAVPAHYEEVPETEAAFGEFQDFWYGFDVAAGYSGNSIDVTFSGIGDGVTASLDGEPENASKTDQKVIDWLEDHAE